MKYNNNQQAFFALLQAGLWEKDVQLSTFEKIDLSIIEQLAEEQAVVGLVAAGLEHVVDAKLPKEDVLKIVGQTLQIEQRNVSMNHFIETIINEFEKNDIFFLLIKGQGLAQCYEKPLWRAAGDVDLLLNNENYCKAIKILTPLSTSEIKENKETLEYCLDIGPWTVELHGSLKCRLSNRMESCLLSVFDDCCNNKNTRSYYLNNQLINLPSIDNDLVIIFTHIVKHFFRGGIGLRQICDWSRFIWTYADSLNYSLLESRLRRMNLISEWHVFASLAINWLGFPIEKMPLYVSSKYYDNKAYRALNLILETGNFGHNRDLSYYEKYPLVITKAISLFRHTRDTMRMLKVFPLDSIIAWYRMGQIGIRELVNHNK